VVNKGNKPIKEGVEKEKEREVFLMRGVPDLHSQQNSIV
jgi:hypothetical protein